MSRIFVTYSCQALRFIWKFNSIQEGFWVAAWLLGSSLIAVFKKIGQASLSQAVELLCFSPRMIVLKIQLIINIMHTVSPQDSQETNICTVALLPAVRDSPPDTPLPMQLGCRLQLISHPKLLVSKYQGHLRLRSDFRTGVGLAKCSGRHREPHQKPEVNMLLREYKEQELHKCRPGRAIGGEEHRG